jgi:hypothetical protein
LEKKFITKFESQTRSGAQLVLFAGDGLCTSVRSI